MLNYRNTPSQTTGTSPAQRFLNRRTRTLLPTTEKLLKPKVSLELRERKIATEPEEAEERFDKHAKDLTPLEEGGTVRMKPFTKGDKEWSKATVTRRLDDRSYEVEANGTTDRRNRVHLKKTSEHSPPAPLGPPAPAPVVTQPHPDPVSLQRKPVSL